MADERESAGNDWDEWIGLAGSAVGGILGLAGTAFVGFFAAVFLFGVFQAINEPRPQITTVDQTFMGQLLGKGWIEVEAINKGGPGAIVFTVTQNGRSWNFRQAMTKNERKTFRFDVQALQAGEYSVTAQSAAAFDR